ncbi:hypothetical protein Tco_1485214 [Tanacetum coccineum]
MTATPSPRSVNTILHEILCRFMAALVILISFDSSNEHVGSSISWIILFGTILAEIPTKTPVAPPVALEVEAAIVASPVGVLDLIMYSSTDSDPSNALPSPEHVSTLPATSSFLCTDSSKASSDSSDSLYSSSSETSSPTHDSAHALRQIVPAPPGIPRRPGILVLPGQEIPCGRPYRTQPNGVLNMLTARKRVHLFHARLLANLMRFCSLPSSSPRKRCRSSSSSSSSDSPLGTTIVTPADVPRPSTRVTPATTTVDHSPVGPSRKRYRSPTTFVPSAIPAPGALSPTHADLLAHHKRFRTSSAALSLEASVEESMEIGSDDEDIDSDVMADIVAEAAAADKFRTEVDVGFKGDAEAKEEAKSSTRGTIEIGI